MRREAWSAELKIVTYNQGWMTTSYEDRLEAHSIGKRCYREDKDGAKRAGRKIASSL